MSKEITQHIKRGEGTITAAEDLVELGHYDDAVSRAYYAMFHITTAILLSVDIQRSSHRALISAFGEFITKPGLMNKIFHRYLINTFSARSESDYLAVPEATEESALLMIEQATKKDLR